MMKKKIFCALHNRKGSLVVRIPVIHVLYTVLSLSIIIMSGPTHTLGRYTSEIKCGHTIL